MSDEQPRMDDQDLQDDAGADEAALAALRAESAGLKDQALRYAAEAENTRRRAEREINDARAYAIQSFARDLLGVADNLARALEHAPKDGDDPLARNLAVGLEMTQKALAAAFERNGLKAIDPAPGEKFDPHQHQAMMEQTSQTVAPGAVIQVLQTGYELFSRVVRPAMVVVAAKDSTGPAAGGADAESTSAAPADDPTV
ncbi:MAG: nucleotide exchange factor GrpE [Pseudomonadota bacterium]|nr:nucleotide exchange factor GrpE [Pseudomonadota bacterium]